MNLRTLRFVSLAVALCWIMFVYDFEHTKVNQKMGEPVAVFISQHKITEFKSFDRNQCSPFGETWIAA